MSNIATNTDFIGRFYVANNADSVAVAAELNYLVSTYEELFLRELLGPHFYPLFVAWYGKSAGDRLADPYNVVFDGLLNGKLFENIEGVTRYSRPIKESIMGYLYDKWNRDNLTQTVAMGEVKTDSQNAQPGNPTYKVVDRWNEMVNSVRLMWQWLNKELENDTNWQNWRRDSGSYGPYMYTAGYYPCRGIFKPINRLDL